MYKIKNHIYGNYFNDVFIVLDTKKNNFYLLEGSTKKCFESIIHEKFKSNYKKISINELEEQGIIYKPTGLNAPYNTIQSKDYLTNIHKKGVSNFDWRLQHNPCKSPARYIDILKSLFYLKIFEKFITDGNLQEIIKIIKKNKNQIRKKHKPNKKEIKYLAYALDKAVIFFSKDVRCLLWASVYTLMALKKSWPCQLVVGAQNFPFSSHAWCEIEGLVVMDNQDLKSETAIILREPAL